MRTLARSVKNTQLGFRSSDKGVWIMKSKGLSNNAVQRQLGEEENCKVQKIVRDELFDELKKRFLNFKKHKYLKEFNHFQRLAEAQSPKFMVIGCADSRVCPSTLLGFQPGEAFMIRNVANLVPPLENGPSETNAALEFAVNNLEVENIFVIGHSNCGGIETLMNMKKDENLSLAERWVVQAKLAKLRTKFDTTHHSFDKMCRYCEKESIKLSLENLLTYPWINDKARKGLLSIHGGYYDLLNCTFEKWTLDFNQNDKQDLIYKDKSFWS